MQHLRERVGPDAQHQHCEREQPQHQGLALAVLVMGVWPDPFAEVLHSSVYDLLNHVARSKLR